MKTLGYILIAVGIVLVIVGLFADSLGIGAMPGIGWKQITSLAVGVVADIAGIWLVRRKAA